MATVKITDLPQFTGPLVGTEVIPIVQSQITRQAPLNSITNFLSSGNDGLLPSSELQSISGNWQSTYDSYNSLSGGYIS